MSDYKDILHLSRPVSGKRARMPMIDRAAQFSPFAALTGYDGVIAETQRLTDRCIDLDEGSIAQLDQKLRLLLADIQNRPTATIVYFQPDPRKSGGSYITKTGPVKDISAAFHTLSFADRTVIPLDSIIAIQLPTE